MTPRPPSRRCGSFDDETVLNGSTSTSSSSPFPAQPWEPAKTDQRIPRRMSELPAPRCPRCKTVLSPQWRICVVCKTPIQAVPSVNPTTEFESVLKAGDRLVYREDGTKHLKDGRVQQVVVQQQHLSITLESGKTIQGRQVCSIATNREGAITAARAAREEDLLMTTSAPPISPETENRTSRPPRSAWYQHWKGHRHYDGGHSAARTATQNDRRHD